MDLGGLGSGRRRTRLAAAAGASLGKKKGRRKKRKWSDPVYARVWRILVMPL
jgi:hypothetical protein